MATIALKKCQREGCPNSYVPNPKARRTKYCSDTCNKKAYRQRKETPPADIVVSEREAWSYDDLSKRFEGLDNWVSEFTANYGKNAGLSVIRLLAWMQLQI